MMHVGIIFLMASMALATVDQCQNGTMTLPSDETLSPVCSGQFVSLGSDVVVTVPFSDALNDEYLTWTLPEGVGGSVSACVVPGDGTTVSDCSGSLASSGPYLLPSQAFLSASEDVPASGALWCAPASRASALPYGHAALHRGSCEGAAAEVPSSGRRVLAFGMGCGNAATPITTTTILTISATNTSSKSMSVRLTGTCGRASQTYSLGVQWCVPPFPVTPPLWGCLVARSTTQSPWAQLLSDCTEAVAAAAAAGRQRSARSMSALGTEVTHRVGSAQANACTLNLITEGGSCPTCGMVGVDALVQLENRFELLAPSSDALLDIAARIRADAYGEYIPRWAHLSTNHGDLACNTRDCGRWAPASFDWVRGRCTVYPSFFRCSTAFANETFAWMGSTVPFSIFCVDCSAYNAGDEVETREGVPRRGRPAAAATAADADALVHGFYHNGRSQGVSVTLPADVAVRAMHDTDSDGDAFAADADAAAAGLALVWGDTRARDALGDVLAAASFVDDWSRSGTRGRDGSTQPERPVGAPPRAGGHGVGGRQTTVTQKGMIVSMRAACFGSAECCTAFHAFAVCRGIRWPDGAECTCDGVRIPCPSADDVHCGDGSKKGLWWLLLLLLLIPLIICCLILAVFLLRWYLDRRQNRFLRVQRELAVRENQWMHHTEARVICLGRSGNAEEAYADDECGWDTSRSPPPLSSRPHGSMPMSVTSPHDYSPAVLNMGGGASHGPQRLRKEDPDGVSPLAPFSTGPPFESPREPVEPSLPSDMPGIKTAPIPLPERGLADDDDEEDMFAGLADPVRAQRAAAAQGFAGVSKPVSQRLPPSAPSPPGKSVDLFVP
eukprot:TRINITY_DN56856_c0_g1_i1.p1 TRINITY_DN56856_c0_g1~~TRINITY_DN56856_c0_g1_i1.p1  ORF type:complete len:841 (+),score=130.83 TRINITY_DN56856_c0_g1_i1:206-2728(+)